MISKNQLKHIRLLGQKKYRKQFQSFLVQGEKNVAELLQSNLEVLSVYASAKFIAEYEQTGVEFIEADESTLAKASTLVSNNAAVAVVKVPKAESLNRQGLTLVLDGVSDPGNLGTIIRLADWYGISQIVCSQDCADIYNPKTISATMGSFSRVSVVTTDLEEYLQGEERPVYGAFLEGDNVHKTSLCQQAVLVMGSESHGIRENINQFITTPITIPAFGQAESLNVAVATGIILDNFKR